MNNKQLKIINPLVIILVILTGVATYFGIFNENTYAKELKSFAVQGIGQDIVNLFIAIPAMLISLYLINKGSRKAVFVFGGTVFYFLYSYIIYVFGLHYNQLFLCYCFILALSTYIFLFLIYFLNGREIKTAYTKKPPLKSTGIFILFIAIMFYVIWLKDIVPNVIQGTIPELIIENDFLVNPVHATDLSFALPGLIVIAILLFKDHPMAYIFAPMILIFIIMLTLALIGMMVLVLINQISEDISLVYIFSILAMISTVFLYSFLKSYKPNK